MIIAEPHNTSVEVGNTAMFECVAVGLPTPVINWFVGAQHVGSGRRLSILKAGASHAKVYTCRANNNAGRTEASARLVVYGKIYIIVEE